jgi:ribose 5-phosphate isomerase B
MEEKIETHSELHPKNIGIASDHGGYELKQEIAKILRTYNYNVVDFGNQQLKQDDDYPDYVVPMAQAVANGDIDRGIAVCGSGVGACVAVNKVKGVKACLINDTFSARQGVEDDNLNVICLGGRVLGPFLAWELVKTFLNAQFSGAERHQRRLAKVAELENESDKEL